MNDKLKEYAQLLVRIGLNVQSGQQVNIFSSVDCAVLARACAEACYDAGAREVTVCARTTPCLTRCPPG